MLCFPINLFGGILFQLMVFILAFGNGVSCCGNNLAGSTISGVFGREALVALLLLFFTVSRFGAGGGGAGGPMLIALFDIIGGGGGGAAGILLQDTVGSFGATPSTTNDANGVAIDWLVGASDCFRFGLEMSPRQWGQVNFWMLGVRNKRVESSRFSSNVARCTSVSAVSQMISLIASLGSIRSKCCKILRNGISCGVSATCRKKNDIFISISVSVFGGKSASNKPVPKWHKTHPDGS